MSWVKKATLRPSNSRPTRLYNLYRTGNLSYADPTYPSLSDASVPVSDLFLTSFPLQ
jgi:hypothetical protein